MIGASSTLREVLAFIEEECPARFHLPTLIRRLSGLLKGEEEDDSRRPPAVPTVAEAEIFLRSIEMPRDALMFRLLFAGCLLNGQAISLRVAGLDLGQQRAFFGTGRNLEDRYAALDTLTCELLAAWIRERPLEEVLFAMARPSFNQRFDVWAQASGLRQKYDALGLRFTPSCFRRTMATACHARGMELPTVQLMLGNEDPTVTESLIHIKGIQLRAARYRAALEGVGSCSDGRPARATWDVVGRTKVLDYLRDHLPETARLDDVVEALCAWRLETMAGADWEWLREMGEELPVRDQLGGVRLPYVPPVAEVLALGRDLPVAQFLYRSGIRAGERVLGMDPETGIVRLESREVVVDADTVALVTSHPEVFSLAVEEVRELVGAAAVRTGLAARFAALGRKFGVECLRHAYAVHLYEAGLDLDSLHALLGNEFEATTEMYTRVAVGRWMGEYMRCHPLARGF